MGARGKRAVVTIPPDTLTAACSALDYRAQARYSLGMTTTAAPIIGRQHHGHIVVLAPAATIDATLADGSVLTMTAGPFAGDTVRLGSQEDQGPQGWRRYDVAYELTHPQHGLIKAAFISERHADLIDAPRIRAYRHHDARRDPH
jgi:hypothetical protein